MKKSCVLRVVSGSALAATLVLAPTVVTSSGVALAAYETATTTSTSVTSDPTLVQYGSRPTVTATVTRASGTAAPTGGVRFTVTYMLGSVRTTYDTAEVGLAADGKAVYTFPATAPANRTYRIAAAYLGDANYNGSTASNAFVTMYLRTTTTRVGVVGNPTTTGTNGNGTATYTVQVSVTAGYGTPAGTVIVSCAFEEKGNDPDSPATGQVELVNGAGSTKCTVPRGRTITITAAYYGETDRYATSNSDASPVVKTS